MSFPGGSDSKESACNVGDTRLIPGSERSPGNQNGYPLQYSCLENLMDRGAWWTTVHGVTRSQAWLKWPSSTACVVRQILNHWEHQRSPLQKMFLLLIYQAEKMKFILFFCVVIKASANIVLHLFLYIWSIISSG